MMNVCYNPVTVSRHNYSITTQNNTFTSFDFATSDSDATIATLNEAKQETFDGITTEEINLLAINAEEVMAIANSNHFANKLSFVQVVNKTCSLSTILGITYNFTFSIMVALDFARVLSFAQTLISANNCDNVISSTDCNDFVVADNKNDNQKSLIYYSCRAKRFLSFITNKFVTIKYLEKVIENLYSNYNRMIMFGNLKKNFFENSNYFREYFRYYLKRDFRIERLALCHKLVA